MIVTIDELRNAANVLFDHLDRTGRSSIEIEKDYYWSISDLDAYDMSSQPATLNIGQLSDDWAEVLAISKGEKDAIGYGLVWFASVLRAAGEQAIS